MAGILELKALKIFIKPKTQNLQWKRPSQVGNSKFAQCNTTKNFSLQPPTSLRSQFHSKYTNKPLISIFQSQNIIKRRYSTTTPENNNTNEPNESNKTSNREDPRSFPKDRSFDPRKPLVLEPTDREIKEDSSSFLKLITISALPIAKNTFLYGLVSGVGFEIIKSQTIIDYPTADFITGGMAYGGLVGCLMSFIVTADYMLVEQKILASLSSEILRKVNLSGGLKGGISAKELKKIFEVDLKKYSDSSVSSRNFLLFNVISFLVPRFDSVYDSLARRLSETQIAPNTSASELLVTGLIEGIVRSQLLGWADRFFYLSLVIFLVLFVVAVAIIYSVQKSKIVYGLVKEKVADKISDIKEHKEELIARKDELIEKAADRKTQIMASVQEKIPENTKEKIANTKEKVLEVKDNILFSVKEKMSKKKEETNVGVIETITGREKTVELLDPSDPRSKNYVRFDPQNPETWEDPNLLQTNYKVSLLMREDEVREKEEEKSKE